MLFWNARKAYGACSMKCKLAAKTYKRACARAAATYAAALPDMLKYNPRAFWQWVNYTASTPMAITPQAFAAHARSLYSADAACASAHPPAMPRDFPLVTAAELA